EDEVVSLGEVFPGLQPDILISVGDELPPSDHLELSLPGADRAALAELMNHPETAMTFHFQGAKQLRQEFPLAVAGDEQRELVETPTGGFTPVSHGLISLGSAWVIWSPFWLAIT